MQTSNPAIANITNNAGVFNFGGTEAGATMQGTTNKSILLVAITVIVGYLMMQKTLGDMYNVYMTSGPEALSVGSFMSIPMVAGIAAFVIALVTIFKPNLSMYTAPAYAVAEGAALGTISAVMELKYPGIVSTAVISTFAVVMTMLMLWKFKVVQCTAKFRSVMTGAIMAVALVYIANLIFSLFGAQLLPNSGPMAIGISLIVCTIAAFSLILDFDAIEQSVNQGLPKYFEYYNAFSLLVTICWLYIEILKLLAHREE